MALLVRPCLWGFSILFYFISALFPLFFVPSGRRGPRGRLVRTSLGDTERSCDAVPASCVVPSTSFSSFLFTTEIYLLIHININVYIFINTNTDTNTSTFYVGVAYVRALSLGSLL